MAKTTKTIIWLIIAIVIVGGIWYGIGRKPKEEGVIKIGAILPLTGDLAKYGEGVKNAINMAIEDLELVEKSTLIIEDDHSCVPADSVSAAHKLIDVDKVDVIIGPLCSSAALSVVPVAEENRTILISPSATSPSITTAGDYIFRTIISDKLKSIKVAEFAYNKGYRKAGLLHNIANDSFVQQREDVRETFTSLGGEIVVEESFQTQETDFRSQLTKIKNSDAEIIFFAAWPKEIALFLRQTKEMGINLLFISADAVTEDPDVIEVGEEAAEGLLYAFHTTPQNKEYTGFIARYKEEFGEEPPAYCAEAYDAVILGIKAIEESDGTKEDIKNKLYQIGRDYIGASGEITFDENGDVSKPFIIKTVKNGQFVPYEE